MGEKSNAFVKGGCGCLIAFAVLGLSALAVGGHVRINIGGALCLFALGGIIGLVILMIFNQGKAAGRTLGEQADRQTQDEPDTTQSS